MGKDCLEGNEMQAEQRLRDDIVQIGDAADIAARQAVESEAEAPVDVENEAVEAGSRRRRRVDATIEKCRTAYGMSLRSVAGANKILERAY